MSVPSLCHFQAALPRARPAQACRRGARREMTHVRAGENAFTKWPWPTSHESNLMVPLVFFSTNSIWLVIQFSVYIVRCRWDSRCNYWIVKPCSRDLGDIIETMSMRAIFSSNLQRLCAEEKSHAHVARVLGVNRQQFYSYIKGKNLPNERVIDKICEYFNIDVGVLFRQYDPITDSGSIAALTYTHKKKLNQVISDEKANKHRGIADGLYYIYFSVPNDPESFVCSLLAIRREGGLTTFKRISRFADTLAPMRPTKRAVHTGVVLFRESLLFFMGFDQESPTTPSMLVARASVSADILYSGQAIVHSGQTFQITKFCITPTPKRSRIWKVMKNLKLMSGTELAAMAPTLKGSL